MTIIEAVRMLRDHGGKIRRLRWGTGEFVALHYGQPYYFLPRPGGRSEDRLRGRGQPDVEDILANDWEWSPGEP